MDLIRSGSPRAGIDVSWLIEIVFSPKGEFTLCLYLEVDITTSFNSTAGCIPMLSKVSCNIDK